jgi:hypothetical protein
MFFYSDGENEEDTSDLMGSFCTLSVSASESQYMYDATTYKRVPPFENIVWSEPRVLTNDFRDRISFNLWLLSMADVSGDNVVVRVTADMQKLEIYIKLPRILDLQQVDERNRLLYVDKSTSANIYARTHVWTIAQKKALQSLPCTKDSKVYFKQTVFLPLKVLKTPDCNGYGGIQYKCYKRGLIKQVRRNPVQVLQRRSYQAVGC